MLHSNRFNNGESMDLSKYYEQICKIPMLSKEQEYELFSILKNPDYTQKERDDARTKLINANLRFVFKMAKNYSKNDPTLFEDLISAGNEGLLVGLDKYNPDVKVRFLSYAGWWVIQRILKEMSKMRIVALPIWKQQLAARIMKYMAVNENASLTNVKEAFSDIPSKDIEELFQTRFLTYYIEDMEEEEFEINPIETEVEKNIDNRTITEIVNNLPQPHRSIIIMAFGMEDGKEVNSATIMKKLGLNRDQFREYKKEAMEILRDKFNVENPDFSI